MGMWNNLFKRSARSEASDPVSAEEGLLWDGGMQKSQVADAFSQEKRVRKEERWEKRVSKKSTQSEDGPAELLRWGGVWRQRKGKRGTSRFFSQVKSHLRTQENPRRLLLFGNSRPYGRAGFC